MSLKNAVTEKRKCIFLCVTTVEVYWFEKAQKSRQSLHPSRERNLIYILSRELISAQIPIQQKKEKYRPKTIFFHIFT